MPRNKAQVAEVLELVKQIMNLRFKKVNALQRGDIIAVVQYNGFSFALFWGWEGNGYTSETGQNRKAWYYTIPEWDETLVDVREFLDNIIAGKNRFFPVVYLIQINTLKQKYYLYLNLIYQNINKNTLIY